MNDISSNNSNIIDNILNDDRYVSGGFRLHLPKEKQVKKLKLIQQVNRDHLHCQDDENWKRIHRVMTDYIYMRYENKKKDKNDLARLAKLQKQQKKKNPLNAMPLDPANADAVPARQVDTMIQLKIDGYIEFIKSLKKCFNEIYRDSEFTKPIIEAVQEHILKPLGKNAELCYCILNWINFNFLELPLGEHLLKAYERDMSGQSEFYKYYIYNNLGGNKNFLLSEATSRETLECVKAFLALAGQSLSKTIASVKTETRPLPNFNPENKPVVALISVKSGAGGHTAPHQAMAARLKETGYLVESIHYDTDLSNHADPYQLLDITFEDGTPMTEHLIGTRWQLQNRNADLSKIISQYISANAIFNPDLFVDNTGRKLLAKVIQLNPKLIITTCAYHWSWQSLAYRVPAKTFLVASDVFFHRNAIRSWYRQQDIAPEFRQMHFSTMTDDIELLKSVGIHHDKYWKKTAPNSPLHSLIPLFAGLTKLDGQISVIGAPIHPAFDANINKEAVVGLRKKWGIPDNTVSICISRGKLGIDEDIIPALNGYRTKEKLPKDVIINVVCGENNLLYERLKKGELKELGPNITVNPYPLLKPNDFAELRSISMLDDIKAGGGSTFEGWYLISKGIPSMLLLTPGEELWWENSNCDAMKKWGIGKVPDKKNSKISIIKEIMEKGFPPISNHFPDWKPLFDAAVTLILTRNGDKI